MPDLIVRPTILRWAGSKRQIIPALSEYWTKSNAQRYVEPFAGSACLFFSITPQRAILADINKELILTYKQLKHDWKSVSKKINELDRNKKTYYDVRSIQPEEIKDASSRAARFIYLNRFCFNGLYRTNQSGQFNVPFGDGGVIPSSETLSESAQLLKRAKLLTGDFEKTLEQVRKGDFVYMDPPFSVLNKRVFTDYDATKFNLDKLNRLRQWMQKLDRAGIPFLVSYLESPEARMLSKGFSHRRVSVRRSIAGFASNRRKTREVLISNIDLK